MQVCTRILSSSLPSLHRWFSLGSPRLLVALIVQRLYISFSPRTSLLNHRLCLSSYLAYQSVIRLLSCVRLFATPWIAAWEASLSFAIYLLEFAQIHGGLIGISKLTCPLWDAWFPCFPHFFLFQEVIPPPFQCPGNSLDLILDFSVSFIHSVHPLHQQNFVLELCLRSACLSPFLLLTLVINSLLSWWENNLTPFSSSIFCPSSIHFPLSTHSDRLFFFF